MGVARSNRVWKSISQSPSLPTPARTSLQSAATCRTRSRALYTVPSRTLAASIRKARNPASMAAFARSRRLAPAGPRPVR